MLRNTLQNCCHFPGVALILGAILVLEHKKIGHQYFPYSRKTITSLYPLDTLLRTEFSTIMTIYFKYVVTGNDFLNYLAQFLEDPQQSMTHVFDQQRYATTSKECLQLCLCSHHKFSKRALGLVHQDDILHRSKPWLWRRPLGIHSRIRKGRHHLKVRQQKLLKGQRRFDWTLLLSKNRDRLFSDGFPEHEYHRSLLYRWELDLLPSFLEKSAISLELAGVLRSRTFTTMGQQFPLRMRLAKVAITK